MLKPISDNDLKYSDSFRNVKLEIGPVDMELLRCRHPPQLGNERVANLMDGLK